MDNELQNLIKVARGEAPADLLLVNARVINTFTAQIHTANVSIYKDHIAGIGDYKKAKRLIDIEGRYLSPGFIDGHVHLESSMLNPGEYARAVVPRGILGIVTDFHEIANVCGLAGIEFILKYSELLPMDIFGMAPSCVPATEFETSGSRLTSRDLQKLKNNEMIIGLGEMMNYPGVVSGSPDIMAKINLFRNYIIDGHAPGLSGRELNAYIAAGIYSDHECTRPEEAEEKLMKGMHIMIREGSSEKNLEELLPILNDEAYRRCIFVVDDRNCSDLLEKGDVDAVVRKAISKGLDPIRAIQMITLNTAGYFRLSDLGAVAPGYKANLVVLDNIDNLGVSMVIYHGSPVARNGDLEVVIPKITSQHVINTVHIKPFSDKELSIPAKKGLVPVIEVIPDQIITKKIFLKMKPQDGFYVPDLERDLLKVAVVERHKATGNIGLGFVKGFGLKKGAIATSIGHDSHNIIVVGTNDMDIYVAVKELERLQGGLTAVNDKRVLCSLPLPIAGLLSDENLLDVVKMEHTLKDKAMELGCILKSPFDTLSFLALPVIPELRITDMGVVDVKEFRFL